MYPGVVRRIALQRRADAKASDRGDYWWIAIGAGSLKNDKRGLCCQPRRITGSPVTGYQAGERQEPVHGEN
jgi:hypothetical protein